MSTHLPRSYRYQELSRTEIGTIAPEATVVLPVGAIEQHGLHLPVGVDTLTIEQVAVRASELAAAEIPVVVAPPVGFGASHHHLIYPGALSLSTDTLVRVLKDLTDSLASSGFRRIFVLNGHGGNEECVRLAAREAALRHELVAGAASYWTLAWDDLVRGPYMRRLPGHAGDFETSLMLALRPDLVRMETFPPRREQSASPPVNPGTQPLVHRHGDWARIDGYSDDASLASAEHGRALLEAVVGAVARHLIQFHRQWPSPTKAR